MRLARLDLTFAELENLPALVTDDDRPVVLRVRDADTVITLAAMGTKWSGSWGVWLEASGDYSAGLVARDVKTLSTLMDIEHVVVDAAAHSAAYAEVVDALLSDAEVTLVNAVANIQGAYNRPAPPRPVTVWSVEADTVIHGPRRLTLARRRGALSYYQD